MFSTMLCCDSDAPAPNTRARGPAIAKKATVATNVMNAEVIASGSVTPTRVIVHIIIGPAPLWNGVRYAPQALMPPEITMSGQRTPGCTWRAITHRRVPPPNQSIEESPSPTTSQGSRRDSRADQNAWKLSP